MMDDRLIDALFGQLSPLERAEFDANLDPAAAARLAEFRQTIATLRTLREQPIEPPPELVTQTISRLAQTWLEVEGNAAFMGNSGEQAVCVVPKLRDPSITLPMLSSTNLTPPPLEPVTTDAVAPFWSARRVEMIVMASIGLLAFGLLTTAISKVRAEREIAACQNNLRTLYQGLDQYALTHAGNYPRVGTPSVPTAGAFVSALEKTGNFPEQFRITCPASSAVANLTDTLSPDALVKQVQYAYTLGYRDGPNNDLFGVRRTTGDPHATPDLMPIAADLPALAWQAEGGPSSPHTRGQNILYAGGSVRFSTVSTVGPNGDDIYHNKAGVVRAGLDRDDISLGRPTDVP